jgi:hypothetical protein
MPLNTVVPMARRLLAPAPVAITIGNTPMMKEKAVIRTARKRMRAPANAASSIDRPSSAGFGELHDQDGVFAGQADQQHQADLGVDAEVQPVSHKPIKAPRPPPKSR